MATPYDKVFGAFSRKVLDYSFLNLTQTDLDNVLQGYLSSACVKFINCKVDLSQKDATGFTIDLTDMELEVVALLMVVEWVTPQINNTLLLKQHMSDKDFKIYSQAQHIQEMIQLKKMLMEEADSLIMAYSYSDRKKFEDLR